MARRTISIDEKIERQQEVVNKAKEKYEAAVAGLNALQEKKEEEERGKLVDAILASDKSAEEIMNFLNS